jgi:hypothetical protein
MTTETFDASHLINKELTEEEIARRAGIGERLRAGREEAARLRVEKAANAPPVLASVNTATAPNRPTRTMSELDHFRAERGRRAPVEEEIAVPSDMKGKASGDVAWTAPPLVRMYKLNRMGNYDAFPIPEGNVEACWKAGYLSACPDCERDDCGVDGTDCTAREPRLRRICPVPSCRKVFRDEPLAGSMDDDPETRDPAVIQDDAYAVSTPATRTKAMLDMHMLYYHQQEALSLAPHLQPLISARMAEAKKP